MIKIIKNLLLLFGIILLSSVVILNFLAERYFNKAKELESTYLWKKAGEKYQAATHLNPLNAEYFAGAGDFLLRQSAYRKDRVSWLKRAERLYERASQINPRYAEYWYLLGITQITQIKNTDYTDKKEEMGRNEVETDRNTVEISRNEVEIDRNKVEIDRNRLINSAVENFRKAIELDPYGLRINYLVGYDLIRVWGSLDAEEKDFTMDRLKYFLQLEPWHGSSFYPVIMYYAGDFRLAQKVTPQTLAEHKRLYSFMVKNNLWQYHKGQKELVDFYRQKEEPEEFEREKLARLKRFEEIKESYRNALEIRRNKVEMIGNEVQIDRNAVEMYGNEVEISSLERRNFILRKDWQGESRSGKHAYKNGNMYWTGTIDAAIDVPEGEAIVKIQARGSQADDIWPYMIVELDGDEMGETFVDSPEWKEYSFEVDTDGDLKVLSVTFVNDGGNEERGEDRNLYVGEATIEKVP